VTDQTSSSCLSVVIVFPLFRTSAPKLVKACEKILSVKKGNERSKSSALALLTGLCQAPGGVGGQPEIASVFKHVQTFLSAGGVEVALHREGTSKALRLDALSLVHAMLVTDNHDPVHVRQSLRQTLFPELCLAVKEQWYKVIAEALRALAAVPRFFVLGYTSDDTDELKTRERAEVAAGLYTAVEPLLAAHDVDQEVKECALKAAAALLSSLHVNLTVEQKHRMLALLLDRLKNETTRISAIKTLSSIASASSSGGNSMEEHDRIDLSPIMADSITTMASFLKLQSRSLKQHSLESVT
jgi:cullin-associated NEDD8-dissociated protein 1